MIELTSGVVDEVAAHVPVHSLATSGRLPKAVEVAEANCIKLALHSLDVVPRHDSLL